MMNRNVKAVIGFGICLILLGAVFTYFWYQECQLSKKTKPGIQTISMAKLIERGYGDNAYVRVTGAAICPTSFVYSSKSGSWETVWIALMPVNGQYMQQLRGLNGNPAGGTAHSPAPGDIRVILKSNAVHDREALDALAGTDTFEGTIVNDIEGLGRGPRRLLEEGFPGTDFSRCLILDHRRHPSVAVKTFLLIIGPGIVGLGLLCVILSLGLGWRKTRTAPVQGIPAPSTTPSPTAPPATPASPPFKDDMDNPYARNR